MSEILTLTDRVKAELELVEQRLAHSRTLLATTLKASVPADAAGRIAKTTSQEAALREDVLAAIGGLQRMFSSRSSSVVVGGGGGSAAAPTASPVFTVTPTARGNSPTPSFGGGGAGGSPAPAGGGRTAGVTPTATPTARQGTPPPSGFDSQHLSPVGPGGAGSGDSRSGSAYSQLQTPTMTPTSRSSSVQPPAASAAPRPPPPPPKAGQLMNYGLPSIMRSFKSQYVLIDTNHVKWFKAEADFASGAAPAGSVPLTSVQKNSRGSVIRQTAACWPLLTDRDCPKANDKSKHYFAVQYFDAKDQHQLLVLGAGSWEDKRAWVHHLAQLIPLHLPADAPTMSGGEQFIEMASTVVPHHTKTVLDGEAPKH